MSVEVSLPDVSKRLRQAGFRGWIAHICVQGVQCPVVCAVVVYIDESDCAEVAVNVYPDHVRGRVEHFDTNNVAF